MNLRTPATELMGIHLPIVQAGMSWASSSSALPLAVSRAGGLGVIAAGPMRLPDLERCIDEVVAGTRNPFAVNVPLYRQGVDEVLDLLEAKPVPVIIASQGGPKRYVDRFRERGTVCVHVVASPEHAANAVSAGVDAVVVVGGEAGGHPPASLVSSMVMVRRIVLADPGVPIIASGGFADGAGLAAALSLGADAVQFGTRFIATPEASVHPKYKAAVLAAEVTDTRTTGTSGAVVRTLANAFTAGMDELEGADERQAMFAHSTLKMAARDGDVDNGKVEAGQSAGLVHSVVPAAEVVHAIAREYFETVDRLAHLSSKPAYDHGPDSEGNDS